MNIYFLTEDSQSFIKVLPTWLNFLEFPCERVNKLENATGNSYILESGYGVQQLIDKTLLEALNVIDSSSVSIDWLVIILDSENRTIYERETEVKKVIDKHYSGITPYYQIKIIVARCCFETWLLGDRALYPNDTKSLSDVNPYLLSFVNYYDVKNKDPQLMHSPANFDITDARYHFSYLHELCRNNNVPYSKSKPDYAKYRRCFNSLVNRIKDTNHINTFKELYDFIKSIS